MQRESVLREIANDGEMFTEKCINKGWPVRNYVVAVLCTSR